MKKKLLLAIGLIWMVTAKSQTVTIPDVKFVSWLQANVPNAMNGNQMDTTDVSVTTFTSMTVEALSITDLNGVQYFDSLKILDCGNGQNAIFPNFLSSLPRLPSTLESLICGQNQITSLPVLPNTLTTLKCYNNPLHNLPVLPSQLKSLDCSFDSLPFLAPLPNFLVELHCNGNQLTMIPNLPNTLVNFTCGFNQITTLPAFPNSLIMIDFGYNQISTIPTLPTSLQYLGCNGNLVSSIPVLPNTLTQLGCANNSLANLPTLPGALYILEAENNHLSSLPPLPNSLGFLQCGNNFINNIFNLPPSLIQLVCANNQISCFPPFPNTLVNSSNFDISGNNFTCLPNYVPAMNLATLAYPLCNAGNANGCPNAQGLFGFTYNDINANCIKNAGDTSLKNIAVQLFDNTNNLLGQTYSASNGVYDFPQTMNTYKVVIDTLGSLPFVAQCAHPGLDSLVTVNLIDTNINFSLVCKQGFDVGMQSVAVNGLVFPGQQHELNTIAGDLSQWYNLNCATGVSGQVIISISGPVNYAGPAAGALTPSISGNIYTYTIADFGTVNITTAFNLLFITNTSAQAGDPICVNISVTPSSGDNNISNNNYVFCYEVVNSHDPNHKEVYPVNVAPGYSDWLTYTIHFQNTGTANAINISLKDTLDTNLDVKTFQLINYSHKNATSLMGNIISFNFININLPDSTSNLAESQAFIQYRIKPKANLTAGTQIKNTANIYFDYNAPISTNTTVNSFITTGIDQLLSINNQIKIYPNPSNGNFVVQTNNTTKQILQLFDVTGELVLSQIIIGNANFNLPDLNDGVYSLNIISDQGIANKKLVIVK